MSLTVRLVLSGICLAGMIIASISLKIIQKKNRNNPDFVKEQKEREDAYRERIRRENERLLEYGDEFNSYSDAGTEPSPESESNHE